MDGGREGGREGRGEGGREGLMDGACELTSGHRDERSPTVILL